MQHNPQAFRLIANLLAAWEKEGFAVGVETQLQLRELTQKLPDDTNIQNLKTLLAPLFANSRDEQELFYELFDKNVKENEQFFIETAQYAPPSKPIDTPSVQTRFKWLFGILALILLAILGYFIYKNYPPKPPVVKVIERKYEDLIISTKDKGEHELYFNQYDTLDSKIKSITNFCPEKTNKNARVTIKNTKQLFYEAISKGIDTVCIQFCFENKTNCDTTYYRFIVDDFKEPEGGVITKPDTLAFKNYKHTPDIATLIPTVKMRFGYRFAYWDWTKTFIFLGILAAILALGKWLNRLKELIFKDLKGNDKAPYAWTVKIDGADKIGLNDIFYTASNQLRRRSDNEISRFDVPRTVTATIKQAGRVNFQYRQLTQSNEYLLLIDMPSAANHQSQLFNFLNKALSDNEVLIDRFFYDGDIRLCWNETYKRGISLKDLQHHYSEHRLIIVGSGHSFLSPLNGKLAKWATIFDHWRIKALFSTRPASEWDMREAQLAQKFRILPASLKGIGELVETIEAVEAKDYRLWKTIKDPSVQPLRLPDSLTDDELMTVLKAEFMRYNNRQADDRLVQWIAACAVYPTMHWDLTLALGASLGVTSSHPESLVNLDNLFTINRLSWFVDGKMPEAVRKTLLKWLAETHPSVFEQTRRHLAEILKNCQPPSDSIAYEDYRLQMVMNELLLKPNPRQRKALETELEKLLALDAEQDFLVAEYLNRPRTPLDFVVPDNLRKYVRVQETNRLPRTPQWVWQSLVAVPALICLWFFNPHSKECDGESGFHNNTYYCLQTPQDSLIFFEQMLSDTIEIGRETRLLEMFDLNIRRAQDSLNLNVKSQVNYSEIISESQTLKDSITLLFSRKGYPKNASMEEILLAESFNLIRQNALDTASFYKNIPIAYWNAGVLHYNQSFKIPAGIAPKLRGIYQQNQLDSACNFFTKLDKWAWRDSVLTREEVAFLEKRCYPEIVEQQPQNLEPTPQLLQDRDFEPYQTRKQYGFRNSKTQDILIPPQYQNAYYFSERLAAVKVNNKWGFIDRNNNMVIPPQYDNVSQNFKNGRAQVQVGKETFFIDKKGKRIAGDLNTNLGKDKISTVPSKKDTSNVVEQNSTPLVNIIFFDKVSSDFLYGARIDIKEANTGKLILTEILKGNSFSTSKIEVGKTYVFIGYKDTYEADSALVVISKDRFQYEVRLYLKPVSGLPITLFFDDNQPDPNSTDSITKLPYSRIYQNYIDKENDYLNFFYGKNSNSFSRKDNEISIFFRDSIKYHYSQFNEFLNTLNKYLSNGKSLEIAIEGYTAPIRYQDYNRLLSSRCIMSVINEITSYRKGTLSKYIQNKQLSIRVIPFGETKARRGISDDPNDSRNSIYSINAMRERKVEIKEIHQLTDEEIKSLKD